jgi:hypothetical protein
MEFRNCPKTAVWAVVLFVSLVIIPTLAFAQGAPCLPHKFKGTATVNGIPAPTGLEVTAKIDGLVVEESITVDGTYGYDPWEFKIYDPYCQNEGKLVEFYIEGVLAASVYLGENGYPVVLNISATGVVFCGDGSCAGGETCSTCPADCGACSPPPSGGGSPPSGGGTPPSTGGEEDTTEQETGISGCTPDWRCSPWSQCINFTQDRECIDIRDCGRETGRPTEVQECGTVETYEGDCETEGERGCKGNDIMECIDGEWSKIETCSFDCAEGECVTGGFDFTGMFLNPVNLYAGFLIVLVILSGVLYFKFK